MEAPTHPNRIRKHVTNFHRHHAPISHYSPASALPCSLHVTPELPSRSMVVRHTCGQVRVDRFAVKLWFQYAASTSLPGELDEERVVEMA